MSLTSHLGYPTSPVLGFLRRRFPNTRSLVGRLNKDLKGAATIAPPERDGYPRDLVGVAADYRIRFYFLPTPVDSLVAHGGAARLKLGATHPYAHEHENFEAMLDRMEGVGRASDELFRTLDGFVGRVKPASRALSPEEEDRLCRYCFVLACFEQVFRAGGHPANPLFSENASTAHALLALPPSDVVHDLAEISRGFRSTQGDLLSRPATMNPNFAGSADVGGADADLIVDGCLVEIKTLAVPKVTGKMLHQLVGYVLLDYRGEHQITDAGFYLARQTTLVRIPLPELLRVLAGEDVDLPDARAAVPGVTRTARAHGGAREDQA